MPETIDARGLSCPLPVMRTRQALQSAGSGEVTILVDTMTQVDNCTRTAEALGWQVTCQEKDNTFELSMHRSPTPEDAR